MKIVKQSFSLKYTEDNAKHVATKKLYFEVQKLDRKARDQKQKIVKQNLLDDRLEMNCQQNTNYIIYPSSLRVNHCGR